jgi:hypothetical protein
MILATALSLLLAVTTYPSFASASAMGAVYDSPIVKKMSPIQRVLEQRRLHGSSCTRTIFGNTTTTCKEDGSIVSFCNVYPDGHCSYTAVDVNGLEALLESLGDNMTIDGGAGNATANVTTEEDILEGLDDFDALILIVAFYIAGTGSCSCADSTPDCSMTNITEYHFNACTVDVDSSYTCELSESDDKICCDVVDSKGEMECCRSETEASIEYSFSWATIVPLSVGRHENALILTMKMISCLFLTLCLVLLSNVPSSLKLSIPALKVLPMAWSSPLP